MNINNHHRHVGLRARRANAIGTRDIGKNVSRDFYLIVIFLAIIFVCGGSSRSDIAPLIVLRPAACCVCVYGIYKIDKLIWSKYRWIFTIVIMIASLLLLEIIPLPTQFIAIIPGRELISEVIKVAELRDKWMPISVTPFETCDTLWSLSVPIGILLLAARLNDADQIHLSTIILAFVGLDCALSVAQLLSDSGSMLYLYKVGNDDGNAKGLFANKNHHAIFVAASIPIYFARFDAASLRESNPGLERARRLVVRAASLCFIPFILVANSRVGLMSALVAAVSTLIFVKGSVVRPVGKLSWAVGATVMTILTFSVGRALSWDRLFNVDAAQDLRFKVLPSVLQAIRESFPIGFGGGSFSRVYLIFEPDRLLSDVIMNQAHNDWLDLLLTHGILGVCIVFWSIFQFVQRLHRKDGADALGAIRLKQAAACGIFIIAIAALFDYALRTPIFEALLMIFCVWLTGPKSVGDDRTSSSLEDH